jgi:Na+-driven multidrug efflux pump
MICVSGFAYHIWVGDAVNIPFRLSVLMACFAVITMWNAIFGYFASGIGKIRLQLFIALFTILVSIPLSILLGRRFGISGVILGTNICLLTPALLLPIQYRKIIQGKSGGIWVK